MECPNCRQVYRDTDIQCASCGQIRSIAAIAELQNLEFLAAWLDEHQDELQWKIVNLSYNVHTVWKNFDVPLHPGAARYYKEKGYMK